MINRQEVGSVPAPYQSGLDSDPDIQRLHMAINHVRSLPEPEDPETKLKYADLSETARQLHSEGRGNPVLSISLGGIAAAIEDLDRGKNVGINQRLLDLVTKTNVSQRNHLIAGKELMNVQYDPSNKAVKGIKHSLTD